MAEGMSLQEAAFGNKPDRSIIYYTSWGVALFRGPGGFTQIRMDLTEAQAIGVIWAIDVKVEP